MEGLVCRLLPYAVADGPYNMAADEAMLHSAGEGKASLRFYAWSSATLSLGYFQPERVRFADPLLASLPSVRRPSGGETLVHHHELTYALALPAGGPWQGRALSWLRRMHGIIADALELFGVDAHLFESLDAHRREGPLCFRCFTPGDLMVKETKIAGSAQRKKRGALLQHGAILLARSNHTPSLPGVQELAGLSIQTDQLIHAIQREFAQNTGWSLAPCEWTPCERDHIADLVARKYAQDVWNRKR